MHLCRSDPGRLVKPPMETAGLMIFSVERQQSAALAQPANLEVAGDSPLLFIHQPDIHSESWPNRETTPATYGPNPRQEPISSEMATYSSTGYSWQ